MEKFKRFIVKENRRDVMRLAYEISGEMLKSCDKIIVEIRPKNRSDDQNSKFHALLRDISIQKEFCGKKRTIEQWKHIFISAHAVATGGNVDYVTGIEGEMLNIRESSAKMTVSRMSSLIEYVSAWAVNNGVKLNDYHL